MSDITIRKISSQSDKRKFVRFNYELYKDCPYAVPDFLEDTMDTFDREANPAFEFCEAEWFLAYRDGRIVGRVVAIINRRANERWGTKRVRFGWIDFVDDREVSKALLEAVEAWGRERGMTQIVGPLGFTDLDPEGMVFEGFDRLGTMPTIYNYAYYNDHMKALGFVPEAVWVDRTIKVPNGGHVANSEKFFRVAQIMEKRFGFRVHKFHSKRELRESGYIRKMFEIINTSYRDLYGYSEMSGKQMDKYAESYLPLMNIDLISVVDNREGIPVAVGVCMPNLAKAVQRAKAKLWPFGWWHLLKALHFKHSEAMDLLLIGVLPEYQDTGCVAMIFADIIESARRLGFERAECCPQLETNTKALSIWQSLESKVTRRRRTWRKGI